MLDSTTQLVNLTDPNFKQVRTIDEYFKQYTPDNSGNISWKILIHDRLTHQLDTLSL